jgi:hypothetical protein
VGAEHPVFLTDLEQAHNLMDGYIKGEGEGTPGSAVAALVALRYLLAAFTFNRGDKSLVD